MPDRIELDDDNLAKNFVEAIKQGIKSSMTSPISDDEIEKRRKEEIAERERKAEEFRNQQKQPSNDDLVSQIKMLYGSASNDQKLSVQALMKEIGVVSFADPSKFTVEQLEKIITILS